MGIYFRANGQLASADVAVADVGYGNLGHRPGRVPCDQCAAARNQCGVDAVSIEADDGFAMEKRTGCSIVRTSSAACGIGAACYR